MFKLTVNGIQPPFSGTLFILFAKNTLGEYLQKIMEKGDIEGHFQNHSLPKATTTQLFEQGMDPQLIKEVTGHKSNAVMLYKKSNLKMKQKLSDMLNGLPAEIQMLRDYEQLMLETENRSGKKISKVQLVPPLVGLLGWVLSKRKKKLI